MQGSPLYFFSLSISQSTIILLVVTAVPTEAADAAIDHLDATEDELQAPQAQGDGEEDQVPQRRIGRDHTQFPQGVVKQVTSVPTW